MPRYAASHTVCDTLPGAIGVVRVASMVFGCSLVWFFTCLVFVLFVCLFQCTNSTLLRSQTVLAISSPTYDTQPVFEFTARWDGLPYRGQPTRYEFPWVAFQRDSAQ